MACGGRSTGSPLPIAARRPSPDRLSGIGGCRMDRRVDVLGVGISITSLDAALADIASWVERGERQYVCVTNVHTVMESQRDEELRRIQNASGLTVPDGRPIAWSGQLAGAKEMSQVR